MLLSQNRFEMRRSSAATSDGQMDHGQARKPRISRQKPVTWPDTAFGHLTGYVFVERTSPRPGALAGGLGRTPPRPQANDQRLMTNDPYVAFNWSNFRQ